MFREENKDSVALNFLPSKKRKKKNNTPKQQQQQQKTTNPHTEKETNKKKYNTPNTSSPQAFVSELSPLYFLRIH